ncbi:MAG: hypothetical protein ACR2HN_09990 [Tepidiformaceae bacterium]
MFNRIVIILAWPVLSRRSRKPFTGRAAVERELSPVPPDSTRPLAVSQPLRDASAWPPPSIGFRRFRPNRASADAAAKDLWAAS